MGFSPRAMPVQSQSLPIDRWTEEKMQSLCFAATGPKIVSYKYMLAPLQAWPKQSTRRTRARSYTRPSYHPPPLSPTTSINPSSLSISSQPPPIPPSSLSSHTNPLPSSSPYCLNPTPPLPPLPPPAPSPRFIPPPPPDGSSDLSRRSLEHRRINNKRETDEADI